MMRAYLDIAMSACEHIEHDLAAIPVGDAACISYIPTPSIWCTMQILLGPVFSRAFMRPPERGLWRSWRGKLTYTPQLPTARMVPGTTAKKRICTGWITSIPAMCSIAFRHYEGSTGDTRFDHAMMRGYWYWKKTFFLPDGTPVILSQDAASGYSMLLPGHRHSRLFRKEDPESVTLAAKVAEWTIENMQDPPGYFYYRRYSRWIVNKTPTLHWGQATMFCALAGLCQALAKSESRLNAFAAVPV